MGELWGSLSQILAVVAMDNEAIGAKVVECAGEKKTECSQADEFQGEKKEETASNHG